LISYPSPFPRQGMVIYWFDFVESLNESSRFKQSSNSCLCDFVVTVLSTCTTPLVLEIQIFSWQMISQTNVFCRARLVMKWDKKKGSVECTPISSPESRRVISDLPPLLLILDNYVTLFTNWNRARRGDSPEVKFVFINMHH
jgi:hypothetical protein